MIAAAVEVVAVVSLAASGFVIAVVAVLVVAAAVAEAFVVFVVVKNLDVVVHSDFVPVVVKVAVAVVHVVAVWNVLGIHYLPGA